MALNMGQRSGVINVSSTKSNASSNLKKDYRVILFDSKGLVHSVIIVSSTKCVSKLGHGGVYITTLKEIKKQYNAKNIQVYIPVK